MNRIQPRRVWRARLNRALAMAGILLAAACSENNGSPLDPNGNTPTSAIEVHPTIRPQLSSVSTSSPVIATCGNIATFASWSNPYVPGGSVTVSNDANNIYVTYNITDRDWYLTDTRLAVEKVKSAIPMEDATTPAPWDFKLAGIHDPAVKTFTYTVSLASLNAHPGETVYVAAMSGVVYPVTGDYEGDWEWRTAWAVPQGKTTPLIQAYVIQGCGETQPPPPPPPPPPANTGIISISFDDGWKETYTIAFPILQSLGLVANTNINSEPIDGGWSAYMTLADVRALHDAGWAVASHSVSHADLTQVSATQLEAEIRDNKKWISDHGFGDSPVFVVPFHSWGQRERTIIQKYHVAARGYTIDQFSPEKFVSIPITQPYDLTAFEPEYAPFTTAQGRELTMEKVRYAIENGLYLDIFFHHLTQSQKPAFQELMTQIAQYKSNIRTYDQIF